MARGAARLPAGLKPLISRAQIAARLRMLARGIPKLIPAAERPIAIVVLQGGFVFAADLLRELPADYPLDVAFLRCQSYGTAMYSSGRVLLLNDIDPSVDLRERTVLLIDDILDTGLTTEFLMRHLRSRGAARVRLCVLLHRRHAPRRRQLKPDLAGFTIGRDFVVGYGLDYAGKYRNLPQLAAVVAPPALRKLRARKNARKAVLR